ncbi:FAD-dependent monooxygenase [Nonomuraea angiospora]|uniref:FAD-dependent monooxygenase n=1 Tax=Nonomuraea angiospora TaxID=46172 RepID=UPI00331EE184
MNEKTADVLIVGAGPTGLTLAVDLARRGVAGRVVDRRPAPTLDPLRESEHPRIQRRPDQVRTS